MDDLQLVGEQLNIQREGEVFVLDPKDGFKVDATGNRLWPNGKPMLNSSGKLVWDDGTVMLGADGKLSKKVDPSKPPS